MDEKQFYTSNNLEKYPNDGKLTICKKCITMHVDNWNPDTYLWILQEVDVPYVPDEWTKLLAKYARDKSKLTGTTILGRYLSKMKLKQFKDYRWKDTEFLQELQKNKIEQAMRSQGYGAAEITTAVEKVNFDVPTQELRQPAFEAQPAQPFYPVEEEDPLADSITDEEKTALRLKWGKDYRVEEWVKLEKLYDEMYNSYDIQNAGHIDTLKLICKTSLKANQLLDLGDQ